MGCSIFNLVADAAMDVLLLSFSLVSIPSLMLSATSVLGSNWSCLVLRNAGPLALLLDCKVSADIPQVPASAWL